eukprot:TRINITY_DN23016_c0_g1_i1.p1 TRINITY_DN23016_c0_g1~~TRINITY_DN23016_c0_g1_i1.p1  ORF type:complete len:338 (+),score=39.71 TRINITY_DN23016_c0_g1_i1:58-1071(+)
MWQKMTLSARLYYGVLLSLLWTQTGRATSRSNSRGLQPETDLDLCPAPTSFPPRLPERCCNTCPSAARLWTMPVQPGFQQTKIAFVNKMKEPARLRWVDPNGVEHDKDLLAPGATVNVLTHEGHVTRAYSEKDGRLLVEHMAGRRVLGNDAQVDMAKLAHKLLGADASVDPVSFVPSSPDLEKMNSNPEGKDFRETPTNGTVAPENYPSYGFVNMLSVDVRLFFRQDGHEYHIYELKPGEVYYERTYPGHEWLARTRDGQLLTEFRVAPVPITDCDKQEENEPWPFASQAAQLAEGVEHWLEEEVQSATNLMQGRDRRLRGFRKSPSSDAYEPGVLV